MSAIALPTSGGDGRIDYSQPVEKFHLSICWHPSLMDINLNVGGSGISFEAEWEDFKFSWDCICRIRAVCTYIHNPPHDALCGSL